MRIRFPFQLEAWDQPTTVLKMRVARLYCGLSLFLSLSFSLSLCLSLSLSLYLSIYLSLARARSLARSLAWLLSPSLPPSDNGAQDAGGPAVLRAAPSA
jgi:hypothetical protein